ncbi:MAG: hypothetical protein KatS3mg090_0494 [Patescibacteria group bacterium]|nr:MAG: hypothetical protein KatS3mg090_0494 [Patescibacteria group bacterium]
MKKTELMSLRSKLDKIDEKLLKVLNQRFNITRQIGKLKAEKNLPEQDKNRENEKLQQLATLAKEFKIDQEFIQKLYRLIFKQVVSEHKQIKRHSLTQT